MTPSREPAGLGGGAPGGRGVRRRLEAPGKWLADVDPEAASRLVAAASDLALVIDAHGLIQDLAFGSEDLAGELDNGSAWIGQPWTIAVTVESRPKIEALLREAGGGDPPRWRQVNHPTGRGADVPVMYSAVKVGAQGAVVALGRDLRAIALLQQRLVDAQQSLERDYWRMRQVETRYRLLFQSASEAVLIVDAGTQKILEANPAAAQLLADGAPTLAGRAFPEGFDAAGTRAIAELLGAARRAGRADAVRARLAEGGRELSVSASLFRQEDAVLLLVRLSPADVVGSGLPRHKSQLLKAAESVPDALVVTAADGRILAANRAFLELAQLATEEQARGESLDRWLGRPGVDLSVLTANLRQHGTVRLFATTLRGEYGTTAEVEISAVALVNGEQPCLGFTIRNIGRRLSAEPRPGARELPRSVDQLTELVGRVSLKDLVREATDVIERLCIEAALEMTGDNRASAAEMLGLSRQSLYVKLRRYGLGDLSGDGETEGDR